MVQDPLLIGLDFGSDSVRAVLVDSHGKQLATAVHPYRRWNEGLYSDAAVSRFRQHPLDYLEGTESVIRSVMKGVDPELVASVMIFMLIPLFFASIKAFVRSLCVITNAGI